MSNLQRTVWVVRHAERIDFVEHDWSERPDNESPYDPHLSANGYQQAKELAAHLRGRGVDHVVSSPFRRTLETADAIASACDLPIKLEDGACECLEAKWFPTGDPRKWTLAQRAREFPRIDTSYASVLAPTYPETWETCWPRAARTMQLLVEKLKGNLLVVAHGASRSGLVWGLVDGHPQLDPGTCALCEVALTDAGWQLISTGDRSFLSYTEDEVRFH